MFTLNKSEIRNPHLFMSSSEMEILKRCLACGASVRSNSRFCPQCGISFVTGKNLMETTAKKEEEMNDVVEENEYDYQSNETAPLSAFKVEDREPFPNETAPLIIRKEESDFDSRINDTVPLSEVNVSDVWTSELVAEQRVNETVPLTNKSVETETDKKDLLQEIDDRVKTRKSPEDETEFEADELKKERARERSRSLVEKTRAGRKVKQIVVSSQDVLDRASPDPSIRFFIVTLVLLALALLLFFFSRNLK